ncbi:MAG: hypothetical protein A2V93_07555 [Ignavibacteria bacterium RBG_16_34_14]|nr:MAG: hypothetical protein A2V93_07555 [Ignavibacteria bacterium RBG_16_34_14]
MNNQNNLHTVKTLERKNFFIKLIKSFIGLVLFSSFPLKLFNRNNKYLKKAEIKINPLAVSRNKDNRKND